MKGPELHGFETAASPLVNRDVVLDAIVALHAKNPEVDFTNLHDEDVEAVRSLFSDWTKQIRELESAEKRLMGFLEQNMIMFDAGLITNKEGLKSLENDLNDQLEQVRGDSFVDYEKKIGEYKQRIEDLLRRADK